MRGRFRDAVSRRDLGFFYAAHRSYYMQERVLYGLRRQEAGQIENRHEVLSMIMDGMQQAHSEIPWFGNRMQANHKIKQHLQGVTLHHHRKYMYRDFNFFKGRADRMLFVYL